MLETTAAAKDAGALDISVQGIVQGVGFRPFVYRLAHALGLSGSIANNGDGVQIHISGPLKALDSFTSRLATDCPPVARITSISIQPGKQTGRDKAFNILPSENSEQPTTQIAPDIATCDDCLGELLNPADRRFLYPFTNCTNCGPRFTIVDRVPYDRPNTSMRSFTLCEACSREYNDPLDRRFHAQPNACPECGPQLSWHDKDGKKMETGNCIHAAAKALADGSIVAIKGLGGFHLAADASSGIAVDALRKRKRRKKKPLAIMVRDIKAATSFCKVSAEEKDLLTSTEHPIVLLEKKDNSTLAADLAPDIGPLGIMLPYTPVHHLLLADPACPAALVMTSGNLSNEPICTGNEEALHRLNAIADFFLLHNRDILTRVDDSVARVLAGKPRLMRRARGFSPVPISLKKQTSDILACGAEMKNSFCIIRNQEAYLSQHIGELTGSESFDFYTESIDHLQQVLKSTPERLACDLHPDYLSTRYAQRRDLPLKGVQHHHAHMGAVMAEHDLDSTCLGIVLDGTGYSQDGTVFGGEIYLADRTSFSRLGHLANIPMPGGDRAATEPWRMAVALLHRHFGKKWPNTIKLPAPLQTIEENQLKIILQMLDKSVNCPETSSCGRLFDGISSLLGLCNRSDYEGQAAMLLEHQASLALAEGRFAHQAEDNYPAEVLHKKDGLIIDSNAMTAKVIDDLNSEIPHPRIALRFHSWLIRSITKVALAMREKHNINQVILAGGCMQNKLLFEGLDHHLKYNKFITCSGEKVPVNDGGISLGQAYIGGN